MRRIVVGVAALTGLAIGAPNALAARPAASGGVKAKITSPALATPAAATEGEFSAQLKDLPRRRLAGEAVYVGRGCPADEFAVEDPYLADPSGKIALIDRSGCRFDHKVARAQQVGAIGVIFINSEFFGDTLTAIGGDNPTTLPDGTVVSIDIPAVLTTRTAGTALADAAPTAVEVK